MSDLQMVHYGDTDFSVELQEWHVGKAGTVIVGRLAIDHAPNGGQYMRLASPAENALLDALAATPTDMGPGTHAVGLAERDGLEAAWKAAEAALPEGWRLTGLTSAGFWPRWHASAITAGKEANVCDHGAIHNEYGHAGAIEDSPTAALQALASKLRSISEPGTSMSVSMANARSDRITTRFEDVAGHRPERTPGQQG